MKGTVKKVMNRWREYTPLLLVQGHSHDEIVDAMISELDGWSHIKGFADAEEYDRLKRSILTQRNREAA